MRDRDEQLDKLFKLGFKEAFWTIEQTIVWIAYRSPLLAGAVSNESLEETYSYWEPAENDRKYWHHMMAPVICWLEGRNKWDVSDALGVANRELVHQLRASKIVATWKLKGRERTEIPKLHWVDHRIVSNKFESLDVKGGNNPEGSNLVRLDREDVLKLWPPETSKLSDEKRATKLLKGQMEQSLEKPTMTKAEAIDWARTQVPSLGVQAGLRAWRAAVEQSGAKAWSRRGPRSRANRNGTPT